MPGGRRNPHEFGGCAPDSEVYVDVELYSRLRIGAAIARGHPTEVAVAMSELAVLLELGHALVGVAKQSLHLSGACGVWTRARFNCSKQYPLEHTQVDWFRQN